jgi:uncharacterized protein YdeI (YjbR/CyaY-like superfamily)
MRIQSFKTSTEFRHWLEKNHAKPDGLWLRFYKKNSGVTSLSYAEALDQALCYGWIDSQKKPFDDNSWLQKFTPRSTKSKWSKINIQHFDRLSKAGMMTTWGMKAADEARADGRWDSAYSSPKNSSVPEDFLKELRKDKKAKAFFDSLNKANVYSITYRLETAVKPETRARRMKLILEMMSQGKSFHPQAKTAVKSE